MENKKNELNELQQINSVIPKRVSFTLAKRVDQYQNFLKSKYIACNKTAVADSSKVQDVEQKQSSLLSSNTRDEDISKLLRWTQVKKIGAGLRNLGNTCFLNAALQCLIYTPPLANCAIMRSHSASCIVSGFCVFCALESQILSAINANGTVLSPKSIVTNIKKIAKHFRIGRQEDSHELLRYIVDGIQKSCLFGLEGKIDSKINEGTIVHKIFGGHLQSQVKCLTCGYKSNTMDLIMDLCLDIHGNSIESSLSKFTKPEILDKDNKYKCPRCVKLVKAQKQLTIFNPPNILTIQLKRFNYSFFGKIDKPIAFPETLNLSPYISDESNHKKKGSSYKLYAVLVHAGSSTRSGHYYSYVKSSSDIWYCMDDSSISQVSLSTVLKQKAYLLFYMKNVPFSDSNSFSLIPLKNPSSSPAKESLDSSAIAKKRKLEDLEMTDTKKVKLEVELKKQIQPVSSETKLLPISSISSNNIPKKQNIKQNVGKSAKVEEPANKKNDIVKQLISTPSVVTWSNKLSDVNIKKSDTTYSKHRYTAEDAEYDIGRVKKKKKSGYNWNVNPFQKKIIKKIKKH